MRSWSNEEIQRYLGSPRRCEITHAEVRGAGCEHIDDLWNDLDTALEQASQPGNPAHNQRPETAAVEE